MFASLLTILAALLLSAHAQTATTTDGNGNTIVQVTSFDVNGSPTVIPLTTIPASTTSTTASSTTTAAPITQPTVQQGPVGQPATTSVTPGAPIPYIYTTVVNGVTTQIQDIFTPTSPSTVSAVVTGTGSIMDISDYLTMFGTSVSPAVRPSPPFLSALFVALVALVA